MAKKFMKFFRSIDDYEKWLKSQKEADNKGRKPSGFAQVASKGARPGLGGGKRRLKR